MALKGDHVEKKNKLLKEHLCFIPVMDALNHSRIFTEFGKFSLISRNQKYVTIFDAFF